MDSENSPHCPQTWQEDAFKVIKKVSSFYII